jgi:nucleoside-triphosphatase THEP1
MDVTNPLWVLTGERGAGKTTHCRALVEQARASGWDVAGLLSPAIFENEVKTGILTQDLRTGESRPLAVLATQSPFATHHLPLGQWLFDPSVITWGNQILQSRQSCDLFIVDELGPLELFRGEGWVNAFDALRQARYRLGVVVIRPECVAAFAKMGFSFQIAQAGNSHPPLLKSYLAQARS